MAYSTISNHALQIAFWLCITSFIISIAILLEVTWLRFNKIYQEKCRKLFLKNWQPVLVKRALGEHTALPILSKSDVDRFLILWLHFQGSMLGEPRGHLNAIIHDVGLLKELKRRLHKGSVIDRMVAITSFGYLREQSVWNELENLVRSPVLVLSILAARALVSIDSAKAILIVFPLFAERRDWPAQKVAQILNESPEIVDSFLNFIEKAIQEKQPYLIRLLRLLHVQHLNKSPLFIRDILNHSDNPELVLAALKLVRQPRDLDLVRKRLSDDSWQVKVQAVNLLGKLGGAQDIPQLVSLLESKDWWLRYRAASSINLMPLLKKNDLEEIKTNLTDPYSIEMFEYAIATKDIL